MNVLALDLGTQCGYATQNKSGIWDFRIDRYTSAGFRFINFRDQLKKLIEDQNIHIVFFEEVHMHRAIAAAHVYGGFLAITQLVCLDRGLSYKGVGVGTLKKYATGNGAAKKPDMIKAANKFYPAIDILDDNHADALCLYAYATNEII